MQTLMNQESNIKELQLNEIEQVNGGFAATLIGVALVIGARYALSAGARHAIGMAGAGLAGYGLADAAQQAAENARAKGEPGQN